MRATATATATAREAFRVEDEGIDWRSGLAGAVAAVGPLVVGVAVGDPVAGFTAAIGGLNTALCVPRAGLRSRLWWGGLAVVGSSLSVILAAAVGGETLALLAVTLVWVGLLAFFRAAGRIGGLFGFATAAVFVILAGLPTTATPIGTQLWWFLAGAIPGLALLVLARRGPGSGDPIALPALRAVWAGIAGDRALRAHALRLAVAVTLGTAVYRLVGLEHGYWVALTTLAILQPDEHATQVRVVQRAIGTLGGAAVIVAITLVTGAPGPLLACAAVCAFGLYALDHRSYFWLVVLLTPTVLLMISAVDFQGGDLALERVANSALGLLIGLVIGESAWRLTTRRPATAANRDT